MEELIIKKTRGYKTISIIGIITIILLVSFWINYIMVPDTCTTIEMTTQEINAFNSQFISYQGDAVSGSNVKSLMIKLAANYGSYVDEPDKVPKVIGEVDTASNITNVVYDSVTSETDNTSYTDGISKIRNAIINKATYNVEMQYSESGLIDLIRITKIKDNTIVENNIIGDSIVVELD